MQNNIQITTQSTAENVNPGVFIDIDGVVLQGGKPFEWSQKAIQTLWDNDIPFMFVTNGTYSAANLVSNLTEIFNLPFTANNVVVAPSPCLALNDYHDKHVLVCAQEDSYPLVEELGFSSYITIPQFVEIFPDLDYIDHNRRKWLLKNPLTPEQKKRQDEFKPIEAILLLGEPINWECALQILIDVILTNGDPRNKFKFVPSPHLPLIACNKDLTFKGAATLPRFGHGAFLECLESIYMKITKNELVYDHLMGKPYLVTYQFASEQIQKLSKNGKRINKFFIIGDNPDVDVCGANTFKEHLLGNQAKSSKRPSLADVLNNNDPRSKVVESILVCTGVYNPQNDLLYHLRHLFDETNVSDPNNNLLDGSDLDESNSNNTSLTVPSVNKLKKNESNSNFLDVDKAELKRALSRKNSFISYFENRLNIPDVTVNHLGDAVDYIIQSISN